MIIENKPPLKEKDRPRGQVIDKTVEDYISENSKKEKSGSFASFMLVISLVLLFVVILAVMIKMDVGGFGSRVLYPAFRDVPVVKNILPVPDDAAVASESGYKNLYEAVQEIDRLKAELSDQQKALASMDASSNASASSDAQLVKQLQDQISTLKVYADNQKTFEQTKEDFYREVVYNDNVDVSNYTKWYESMDKDTAAKLYKEAVVTEDLSDREKKMAKSYSAMKPAQAAKILEDMSSDIDTVVDILSAMDADSRGQIMGAMDSAFAAKCTKKMLPEDPGSSKTTQSSN